MTYFDTAMILRIRDCIDLLEERLSALVVAFADLSSSGRRLVAVSGWIGLAGVVASAFVIDNGTPYPGFAAILPIAASSACGRRAGMSASFRACFATSPAWSREPSTRSGVWTSW